MGQFMYRMVQDCRVFKELCAKCSKEKNLMMKPNCGTKVPLLAYTFFKYKSFVAASTCVHG